MDSLDDQIIFQIRLTTPIKFLGNSTGVGLPAVFPKWVARVQVRFPDWDTVPKPHPFSAVCGDRRVQPGQRRHGYRQWPIGHAVSITAAEVRGRPVVDEIRRSHQTRPNEDDHGRRQRLTTDNGQRTTRTTDDRRRRQQTADDRRRRWRMTNDDDHDRRTTMDDGQRQRRSHVESANGRGMARCGPSSGGAQVRVSSVELR